FRGHGPKAAPNDRSAAWVRGPAGARANDAARGGGRVRRAGLVDPWTAGLLRGGRLAVSSDSAFLAGMAQARHVPRPPVALTSSALGADAQGSDVRAIGRDGGGADDIAARDTRWRPQLGLSLQLDPGLHIHVVGALQPGL